MQIVEGKLNMGAEQVILGKFAALAVVCREMGQKESVMKGLSRDKPHLLVVGQNVWNDRAESSKNHLRTSSKG